MENVYLGLGTNLGELKNNIDMAVQILKEKVGPVISVSRYYETEPWGYTSSNNYLNAVVCLETELCPEELLRITQMIELEMGRSVKSVNGYADRIIDVDILLYGNSIYLSNRLTIPHPHILSRDFVYRPLLEISPEIIIPGYEGKRLNEMVVLG